MKIKKQYLFSNNDKPDSLGRWERQFLVNNLIFARVFLKEGIYFCLCLFPNETGNPVTKYQNSKDAENYINEQFNMLKKWSEKSEK